MAEYAWWQVNDVAGQSGWSWDEMGQEARDKHIKAAAEFLAER